MRRWVARAATTIEALVAEAGGDAEALADGRVFIGRTRAAAGATVEVGTEITIHAPSPMAAPIEILRQTKHLIAVIKPAGMPTIPDHGGREHALVAATARAAGVAVESLHPTSRLDRDVSGVVVFALDGATRDTLQRARDEGRYGRRYVALALRAPTPLEGRWSAPIGRGRTPRLRAANGRDAKESATRYRTVAMAGTFALLLCEPETGRTHQIRVHAAHAKAPLLGDRDYGGPTRITLVGGRSQALHRIYLHCARVTLGVDAPLEAPLPLEFGELWNALGGEASAMREAEKT